MAATNFVSAFRNALKPTQPTAPVAPSTAPVSGTQAVAKRIYTLGLQAGLPPPRATELVAAAQAESGLNPANVNKSSGAAGLFQLLSSGYRTKAQQLGGLYDVAANTRAILPDYVSYWQQHPNAAPGEAGRDVERSGEGAGFYSSPLSTVRSLLGDYTTASAAPAAPAAPAPAPTDFVSAFRSALRQSASPPASAPAPATPPGGFVQAFRAAIGGSEAPASTPSAFSALSGATPMTTGGKSPYSNLTFAENTDWQHTNPQLLSTINQVLASRNLTGNVISGYRSNDYSARVGGFAGDPHSKGIATDVYVGGRPITQVIPAPVWRRQRIRPGSSFTYHGKPDWEHLDLIGYGY